MTRWKLSRQIYGSEEYTFKEGEEATVGRAVENNLELRSLVISRKHCVIHFLPDRAEVTDCGSSNGVYVGLKKIPQHLKYDVHDSEIIGFGWTMGNPINNKLLDAEKFMFKLTKEENSPSVIDTELDEIAALDTIINNNNNKMSLKRKSDQIAGDKIKKEIKKEKHCRIVTMDDDIISLSDSDHDIEPNNEHYTIQKPNESIGDNNHKYEEENLEDQIESQKFEAFNVKQEYLGYDDDELIYIESDSDSETDNWYLRLSQNSPGKPFSKIVKVKTEENDMNGSYSQMDDDFGTDNVLQPDKQGYINDENGEEFIEDIIKLPISPKKSTEPEINNKTSEKVSDIEEFAEDIIKLYDSEQNKSPAVQSLPNKDEIDGMRSPTIKERCVDTNNSLTTCDVKKTKMIEPLTHLHKEKIKDTSLRKSPRSSSKHDKSKKKSSRRHISNSQKEERKKKLKEIATKDKESDNQSINVTLSSTSKPITKVKITNSNRGAFLTNTEILKPAKKKEDKKEIVRKTYIELSLNKIKKQENGSVSPEDRENKSESSKKRKLSRDKEEEKHYNSKSKSSHAKSSQATESRVPLKSLKPIDSGESINDTIKQKLHSADPQLPHQKPKKKVRFSDVPPKVYEFEIQPGNNMKKINDISVNSCQVDIKHIPVYSLEKIILSRILKWNPNWLREQSIYGGLPPILDSGAQIEAIFHAFANHHQYVQQVGNLLIMEIWECLALGYMKVQEQGFTLEMRIESLPPPPPRPTNPNERNYNSIFSFSVNISLPSHEVKKIPRVGEIMIMRITPEEIPRLFYVTNVRCLPSPPNNIHSFFSIGLQAAYSDKLALIRMGEVLKGQKLACISKELNLFSAIEYLSRSPLCEAILRPQPRHFETIPSPPNSISPKWTQNLNPSQQAAVTKSVSAALLDKPCLQLVQGPPGTGKSKVISSIVMAYFYNEEQIRRVNRGKILICATSNAAVDGLVCRLLTIRQSLPHSERFRMVRVGREEAMTGRARDISSHQLAKRDATARLQAAQPASTQNRQDEISHLEAKINMWKSAAHNAKDPVRVAYCNTRAKELANKLDLLRASGGRDELRHDQLLAAEIRIIEGADIIITTLGSTYNHKLRGLRHRVALCIVDEAGQAIEPETLLPMLALDVTRLTLVGDPQQLPGYICSQYAKKYGLGESLFSRLLSNSEHWPSSPVTLLDHQYRMHPDIADYPNRAFYGGLVRSVPPPRPDLQLLPYVLLAISSGDRGQGACGGNEMEACGVARLVSALAAVLRPLALSLAVITPYNAHKELLKKNLRTLQGTADPPVEVNTIDSFQGQERDVVVVSLARSSGVGFLTDAGRMNVMLTRARHALIVALNPHAMMRHDQWRTLIEDAQKRKLYRMFPNSMCQPVTKKKIKNKAILKFVSSTK